MSRMKQPSDLPIREDGGRQHIERALQGHPTPMANYSFTAPGPDNVKLVFNIQGHGKKLLVMLPPACGLGMNYIVHGFKPLADRGLGLFITTSPRGTPPSTFSENIPEKEMGTAQMARDIETLRTHLGLEKITLVGHLTGAATALSYAAQFPQHVQRIVFLNPSLNEPDQGTSFVVSILQEALEKAAGPMHSEYTGPVQALAMSQEGVGLEDLLPFLLCNPDKSLTAFQKSLGDVGQALKISMRHDNADFKAKYKILPLLDEVVTGPMRWIAFYGYIDSRASDALKLLAKHKGMSQREEKIYVLHDTCKVPWVDQGSDFLRSFRVTVLESM